jgi:hypothetical protein
VQSSQFFIASFYFSHSRRKIHITLCNVDAQSSQLFIAALDISGSRSKLSISLRQVLVSV